MSTSPKKNSIYSDIISIEKELEITKKKISNSKKNLLDIESKNHKNKPLEKYFVKTNDEIPFNTFEELRKNPEIVSERRDANEELKTIIKKKRTRRKSYNNY